MEYNVFIMHKTEANVGLLWTLKWKFTVPWKT